MVKKILFIQNRKNVKRANFFDHWENIHAPHMVKVLKPQKYVLTFFEEDLDVTIHEGTLIVTGQNSQETIDEEKTYLYRGIAGRQFERRFQLADFIEIKSASLQNGLLHINLKREVPEQMKPRKINISSQPAHDKTIN